MIYTDSNLKLELAPYLDPHERLLWAGKPKGGFQLNIMDAFLIPFSIFWCGFSFVWVFLAIQANFFFGLFGIPFIIVGIYMLIGRFIVDKRKRENTVYGLTEQRVLFKTGKSKVEVQSFQISTLPDADLIETSDGLGTISFGLKNVFMSKSRSSNSDYGEKGPPALSQIPDARKVFNQIIQLKETKHENS